MYLNAKQINVICIEDEDDGDISEDSGIRIPRRKMSKNKCRLYF